MNLNEIIKNLEVLNSELGEGINPESKDVNTKTFEQVIGSFLTGIGSFLNQKSKDSSNKQETKNVLKKIAQTLKKVAEIIEIWVDD